MILTRKWSTLSSPSSAASILSNCSALSIPNRTGRYMAPGTLYRPHNERFDENCEPRPSLHPETPRFRDAYNPKGKFKPRIADKRPLRFICEPNRVYWWCSCGHSVKQPFCDGHHIRIIGQTPHFKINKPQFKPIRIKVEEKTEMWLCTCKRTGEPPYCDGSHNCAEVQSAFRY